MRILITGGTGTLGSALIAHYYRDSKNQILCYSRDELKQQQLKKKFPKVTYVLGDIREGIPHSIDNIDIIYHVAALKHIDVLEHNITEALRTNIQGTINVADYAIQHKVPKMAFASTDKAVFPINVYGYTKALGEKYLAHLNSLQSQTQFRIFRWGNVLGSRGSVLGAFKESLFKERLIYLTNADMTRFWIRLDDAVKFMVSETENPTQEGILIPHMKSAPVTHLAERLAKHLDILDFEYRIIGLRPGEKINEDITETRSSGQIGEYATEYEIDDLIKEFA